MKFTDRIIEDLKEVDREYDFWWKEEKEPFKYMVNAIDVLDCLKPYEVEVDEDLVEKHKEDYWDWDNGVLEQMEILTDRPLGEFKCDNTYNWNCNISHDMDFKICDEDHSIDEYCYVAIQFHRSGDVRGNYTDYALYRFDSFSEFVEVVETAEYENCGGELVVDGQTWVITPRIFEEHIECYCVETCDVEYLYTNDDEETIEELRNKGVA